MTVIAMPTPKERLATRLKTAYQRTKNGLSEWVEGTLELAETLLEARQQFLSDSKFSDWLDENGLKEISRQDRQALINMARDLNLARTMLQETKRTSWRYIWLEEMQPRLEAPVKKGEIKAAALCRATAPISPFSATPPTTAPKASTEPPPPKEPPTPPAPIKAPEEAPKPAPEPKEPPIASQIVERFGNGKWHPIAKIAEAFSVDIKRARWLLARSTTAHVEHKETGTSYQYRIFPLRQTIALLEVLSKLDPIIQKLELEGKKNMTTMSPASVATFARELRIVLEDWQSGK